MKTANFSYDLPAELIAQQPLAQRGASRLLCLDRSNGVLTDRQFQDFAQLINQNDLLVFNNTEVIPARIWGQKDSGGRLEFLLERIVDACTVWVHVKASRRPRVGAEIEIGGIRAQVLADENNLLRLGLETDQNALSFFQAHGSMPLPPYIQRAANRDDMTRYQTVYASQPGAVAAPTAGLHFDADMLTALKSKGVECGELTLHVGAGTFQPVRVDDVANHVMHSEYIVVEPKLCAQVCKARAAGGRIIAIGTTVVRCLETASQDGELKPFRGETDIFIYPGYEFMAVDAMLTNFHLPESTLLMLISAFAGTQPVRSAYRHAIDQRYRFFSYGDAMFIANEV